ATMPAALDFIRRPDRGSVMKPVVLLLPLLLTPRSDLALVPDVITENDDSHHVACLVKVDPGAFASSLCRTYVIARGDTLEAIATHECGDACVGEIRLLNPRVVPKKLVPGAKIVIPPRVTTPESRSASRPEGSAPSGWVLFHSCGAASRPV